MQKHNNKNAFTLIELLVVISIIAILMAVMMPALRKAKEQATAVVCSSRQKDMGLAFSLYAQDWKGSLPTANWDKAPGGNYTRLPFKLAPYYDQKQSGTSAELFSFVMYSCPGQPKDLYDTENNRIVERGTTAVGSYGYNTFFFQGLRSKDSSGKDVYTERKTSDIKDGANLPLHGCISGAKYNNLGGGGGQQLSYRGPHPKALDYGYMSGAIPQVSANFVNSFGPAPNHGRNCNMLMGDFSVRAVNVCVDGEFPWQDFVGTMFHPSRASTRGFETR